MKWASVGLALLVVVLAVTAELDLAEPCNEETCKLPDCRCSSTSIPGGLAPRDTPQFVFLTFDDGVNVVNIVTYRTLYNRRNRNGCKAGITFFVNHGYTNYALVNELYNEGYEIALHSITHQTPQSYWAEASYETMMLEFGDQKKQMSYFANIPADQIQGVRIPFLQMAGNSSFQMMASVGLTYDSTWPTARYRSPGLWPYTLHYASTQDCLIPECPTASIPGPWVIPMVTWADLQGFPCSMADACAIVPAAGDEEGWFRFLIANFERHYLGNRAPFAFHIHEPFIVNRPAVRRAFDRFLDVINNLADVFMVNGKEIVDWVQNPVKVDEYAKRPCVSRPRATCTVRDCGPLQADHTEMNFWMQVCTECPARYPWLGNPLGRGDEEEEEEK